MGEIQNDKPTNPTIEKIKDYEYQEKAKSKVRKAGLSFPTRPNIPEPLQQPNGDVRLPEDVTNLSDRDLGRYLSVFSALSSYAQCIVALADIEYTTAENIAQMAERFEILDLPKQRRKNDDLRYGSVHLIDYVFELRQDAMKKQANYKMVEGVLASYERAINSLSREITRRGNEFKHSNYSSGKDNRSDY